MKEIYITAIILITLLGCKNKKSSYRLNKIQHQELRDFFNLKNGSYWVYQDSTLQTLDTFYLTSAGITIEGPSDLGNDDIVEVERGHTTLKSNDSSLIYYDAYPSGEGQELLITSYRGDGLNFNQFITATFPFNEGELKHYWLQIRKYNSLILNGTEYYNVYEMMNTNNADSSYILTFANIEKGVLKFIIHNPQKEKTFELIKCKVIR
jgi:hypothetical protein